jgi:hypothetical protein
MSRNGRPDRGLIRRKCNRGQTGFKQSWRATGRDQPSHHSAHRRPSLPVGIIRLVRNARKSLPRSRQNADPVISLSSGSCSRSRNGDKCDIRVLQARRLEWRLRPSAVVRDDTSANTYVTNIGGNRNGRFGGPGALTRPPFILGAGDS